MDGLLPLLIIGAIAFISSQNKKKKAEKQAEHKRSFQQAFETEARTKKAAAPKSAEKIPFTREEWAAYLQEMGAGEKKPSPAMPSPPKAAPVPAGSRPQPVKPAAPAPSMHALDNSHDEPEGTVSSQGESAAEHAKHRQKILAEEAHILEEHEAMRELKQMNLERLRSAVVMSEVLSKPVSLRKREHR